MFCFRLQLQWSLLEFINIPKQRPINSLLHNTANAVEWTVIRAVRNYISGMIKFTDVFVFILTHIAFVVFPQVMQKQTLCELKI